MTRPPSPHHAAPDEVERRLDQLAHVSFVAHRDAKEVLPALRRHGEAEAAQWLDAAQRLFLHDREAGKAFIRGSGAAERACGAVAPWTRQALQFLRFRGSWKAVEGFMQNLPDAYAELGHAGEERWAQIGLVWCARHLESGAAFFRAKVEDLAARQGVTGIEHLTAPAEELYETRRLLLASYLPGAIKVRNLFGAQLLLPWAQRGADILQAGRLRGEAYFRLESDESLHILMDHMAGFRLADHERLITFLLAIWFDEPPGLRPSDWSPEKGRAFVETDGRELYLPVAMPERDDALLAVIHTAGHIAFGSFERAAIEALFREAGAEHPPLAPDQPITWRPLYATYGEDMLTFSLLFDLCEDLRVDARIAADVPNHLRRLERVAARRAPTAEPAATYYRLALDSVRCLVDPAGVPAERRAEIRWDELMPLTDPAATLLDAFRIANAIYRAQAWPAVATLEQRAEAYLPGRSPNAARAVYPRDAGGDGRAGEGETGDQAGQGTQEQAESPDEPSPQGGAEDTEPAMP
ncbi:MAG TPA: VWA domain-containing protein, partial [Pelomicrobium sp.]|nr:VWA domain-containing protein [Pelomicrobium sp.]